MSRQRDEKLKELEKIWYQKLIDNGFEDIEVTSEPGRPLKEWDFNFCRVVKGEGKNIDLPLKIASTRQYFIQARKLLDTHKFKNQDYKEIWALHCEGVTEREIAVRLKVYKKSMVHYVIKEIAKWIKRD